MTKGRITVTLNLNEKSALYRLAEAERREPRDQAAWLIRQSLVDRGLLKQQRVIKPVTAGQGASDVS